ncbi:MAG: hypothetical protein RR202_06090 [Bacteroidales bacterium]
MMNPQNYGRLLLTAIVLSFLMVVIVVALSKEMQESVCAAIAAIMTILGTFIWRGEN